MKRKSMRSILAIIMSLLVVMTMCLGSATAAFADDETVVAKIGDTEYTSLKAAIEDANKTTGAVIDVQADCEVPTVTYINSSVTLTSTLSEAPTITIKGEGFGLIVGNEAGTYNFSNLNIVSTTSLSGISVHPYDAAKRATVNVDNCNISITGSGSFGTAIDYESVNQDNRPMYFDLYVSNCNLTFKSHGIGTTLDKTHKAADTDTCSINVFNTVFNAQGGTHGIHIPTNMKAIDVEGCTFKNMTSVGIRLRTTDANCQNIIVKNNDFSGARGAAMWIYGGIADPELVMSNTFGAEFTGNNFNGKIIYLLTSVRPSSVVENVWFPEGNTLDANTKVYLYNNWKTIISGTVLSGFAYDNNSLTFDTAASQSQNTNYYYNTKDAGLSYVNNETVANTYMNNTAEANAVTHWYLEDADGNRVAFEEEQAENDVASVTINTATKGIEVSPKANGTSKVVAVIGNSTNAREFTLDIQVGITYTVTYTDGVDNAEVFADQSNIVYEGTETPAFDGTPSRDGYTFTGWSPEVADTVTGDVTYTATWEEIVGPGTNPIPTPPTTPPTTPTPTPGTTPVVTPVGGTAVVNIADNATPLGDGTANDTTDIADNATPKGALADAAWALLNLILAILTVLVFVVTPIIGYRKKQKETKVSDEQQARIDAGQAEEPKAKKRIIYYALGILVAVVAVVFFILTEDMSLPMQITDKWTIISFIIAVVEAIVFAFTIKKKGNNEEQTESVQA